jgi:hypothetical protein
MKKILIMLSLVYSNLTFSESSIRGIGLSKCKTFNNTPIEEKVIYMSWTAGFISSHNILKKKLHNKNIKYNLSQSWLESYCFNNPESSFKNAVEYFLKEFTK